MNDFFVLGGKIIIDGIQRSFNLESQLSTLKCGLDNICYSNGFKKNGDGCSYSTLKECGLRVKILSNQSDIKEDLFECGWNTLCFIYGFKSNKEYCSDILGCHIRTNFERNLKEYLLSKK